MQEVWAPGRVNLIGEHIDYHNLAVLPMALQRGIRIYYRRRSDSRIRAVSELYGESEFEWTSDLTPAGAGNWQNYLRAAARAVALKWGILHGIDATISSDLPAAAGLSSSSALLVGMTLALLRANGVNSSFEELMQILPDGEQFVGTRGGGMDHAACLASRAGCATMVEFAPVAIRHIRIPDDWAFLVAHSLQSAEKSGAAREEYNLRRHAGDSALVTLGVRSYREAPDDPGVLQGRERDAYLHVRSEASRVAAAVEAMHRADAHTFGRILLESHASLRDRLRVSCPALDALVNAAVDSGALGARLTGAGFGGCIVAFCLRDRFETVRQGMVQRYYPGRPDFDEARHLIDARPSDGALYAERK